MKRIRNSHAIGPPKRNLQTNASVKNRLRYYRVESGLSQNALARLLTQLAGRSIRQQQVARYELHGLGLKPDCLYLLSRHFNTDPRTLATPPE